jgi:Kef-type K+ transport system membrane component KefB
VELEFLGNTLFIPMFFITIGFLIDVRAFGETIVNHLGQVCGIVATPILAKWIAGVVTQNRFGYTRDEGLMMWALALPQVAATLAVTLTAYEARDAVGRRLIDEPILNSVLVLVVVTAVLGPILTEVFGKRMVAKKEKAVSSTGMNCAGTNQGLVAAPGRSSAG